MEYLVQRYGNMYLPVYSGMAALLLIMSVLVVIMYHTVCLSKEEKQRLELNAGLKETVEV